MCYTPPWCLFGLNRVRTRAIDPQYGCRLFFFINLMVLGFDFGGFGLKKTGIGF